MRLSEQNSNPSVGYSRFQSEVFPALLSSASQISLFPKRQCHRLKEPKHTNKCDLLFLEMMGLGEH